MVAKTPHNLKLLAGTDKPGRPEYDLAVPEVQGYDEVPPPPLWLDALAVQEYMRLAPILIKGKLLNEGTMATFCHMCMLHAKIVKQYMADLEPPMSWIANFRNLQNDFGLTPHAAGKIKREQDAPKDKPKNKFADRGTRE